MTTKPEGIPQDVWDKATRVVDDLDPFLLGSIPAMSTVARAILAERKRCAGAVETLIESLNEGLMTDAGLTESDIAAMKHQVEALTVAADAIREGQGA